jgi:CheY-like chemotaxis protein
MPLSAILANASAALSMKSVQRKRLLIVEDESLLALTMADQLAELGYAVVGPACTMSEARHLADAAAIDGALLDLNMNGVWSHEIADILSGRKIPFMFVTGYAEPPVGLYRNIRVLQKPFDLIDLMRAIKSLLTPSVGYVTAEQRR